MKCILMSASKNHRIALPATADRTETVNRDAVFHDSSPGGATKRAREQISA